MKHKRTIDFAKVFRAVCKLVHIGYRVFIAYLLVEIMLILKIALPAIYGAIVQVHFDLIGGMH